MVCSVRTTQLSVAAFRILSAGSGKENAYSFQNPRTRYAASRSTRRAAARCTARPYPQSSPYSAECRCPAENTSRPIRTPRSRRRRRDPAYSRRSRACAAPSKRLQEPLRARSLCEKVQRIQHEPQVFLGIRLLGHHQVRELAEILRERKRADVPAKPEKRPRPVQASSIMYLSRPLKIERRE